VRWVSRAIVIVFVVLGFPILGSMLWQVGSADILVGLQNVGFWFIPLLGLRFVPLFCHTLGWAACFQRKVPLQPLLLVQVAGTAINQITPTATIGGEVAKVLLLESIIPKIDTAAAVMIDKASFTLSQVAYIGLGTLYLSGRLTLPGELVIGLRLVFGLIFFGLLGFIAFQRYGMLSKCVQQLAMFNIGRQRLNQLSQRLAPFDAHLARYYTTRQWRFVGSLLSHFVGFCCDGLRTYFLLWCLLGAQTPSFAEAVLVTVAIAAADQVFFFVPGRMGTLEGSRFAILTALHIMPAYGLAFGLVARLEDLSWNGLGLVVYTLRTRLLWRNTSVQETMRSP
jgi:glycosyltransferase 2 family protein